MKTVIVPCSRCGGNMEIPVESLDYYLDCGIQHPRGECNATKDREVEKDDLREYQDRNSVRETEQASDSDSSQ